MSGRSAEMTRLVRFLQVDKIDGVELMESICAPVNKCQCDWPNFLLKYVVLLLQMWLSGIRFLIDSVLCNTCCVLRRVSEIRKAPWCWPWVCPSALCSAHDIYSQCVDCQGADNRHGVNLPAPPQLAYKWFTEPATGGKPLSEVNLCVDKAVKRCGGCQFWLWLHKTAKFGMD